MGALWRTNFLNSAAPEPAAPGMNRKHGSRMN